MTIGINMFAAQNQCFLTTYIRINAYIVFGRYEKSTAVDACTYFENFAALQFREQFENSIIFRFAVENGRFFG